MASVKPVIHGRDHRTGGADPIYPEGEGIRFNFDNVGGWLDIRTTSADGSGYAMHFVATDEVFWDLDTTAAGAVFTVNAYNATVEALGAVGQLLLHSEYDVSLTADRSLTVLGGVDNVAGAGITVTAAHGNIGVTSNLGSVTVQAQTQLLFDSPAQQTTCVTLGDVIALLVSYGLAV